MSNNPKPDTSSLRHFLATPLTSCDLLSRSSQTINSPLFLQNLQTLKYRFQLFFIYQSTRDDKTLKPDVYDQIVFLVTKLHPEAKLVKKPESVFFKFSTKNSDEETELFLCNYLLSKLK